MKPKIFILGVVLWISGFAVGAFFIPKIETLKQSEEEPALSSETAPKMPPISIVEERAHHASEKPKKTPSKNKPCALSISGNDNTAEIGSQPKEEGLTTENGPTGPSQ